MFKAGDQVRCVDAKGSNGLLREGDVYAVVVINVVPGIPRQYVFVDGVAGLYPGWWAHRFRKSTDISDLTALLVEPRDSRIRHAVPA